MSAAKSGRFPSRSAPYSPWETTLPDALHGSPFVIRRKPGARPSPEPGGSHATIAQRAPGAIQHASSSELALECVRTAPLFAGLPDSACAAITAAACEQLVVRGEMIFCEEDAVRSVLVIANGRIKITQLSQSGKEVILRVEQAGEVVDALALSAGNHHLITAQVIEAGSLLSWDIARFQDFICRYPEISRNATRILGERLRVLQERFRDIATERVPQRLARLLLSLIERADEPGRLFSIDFSQEELAQMTGTTLFTVSRVLCEWAGRGIIQPERKSIVIESLPALLATAQETGAEM